MERFKVYIAQKSGVFRNLGMLGAWMQGTLMDENM